MAKRRPMTTEAKPGMTEWLDLMLEEIARKKTEREAAEEEALRRCSAAPRDDAATGGTAKRQRAAK